MSNRFTTWFGTKDSRDEQQGFNAVRVQGNWVQLRIRFSSAVFHVVFKSAVVLPLFPNGLQAGAARQSPQPFISADSGKPPTSRLLARVRGTTADVKADFSIRIIFRVIDFGDDVDNLRYDAAEKRLYVGYGDEKTGAIGIVDAANNKRLDNEFKLGAHPESFQLSALGPKIYVDLPDLKQIAVINRSTHSIVRWPLTFESNFPMALDEADRRS